MEIVKNFGLDPILLGAQVVNFLIILYILKRFAYKPILDILKKREDTIKEGLKQAEEGKKLLEEARISEQKILKRAQERSESIIQEGRLEALQASKKIEENTKRQVEKMLESGREQILRESKEEEKRLALWVSKLSKEFLQSSLKDLFGQEKQKELMQIAMKKIRERD